MPRTTIIRTFGVSVALAALLAACGSDGSDPVAANDDADPGKNPTAVTSDDTVVSISDTDLGQVLVDADGFTLYAFLNDGPNTSACIDQCAQSWPPLIVDGEFEIGLSGAGFATADRSDGSIQLTVDGRPLYRFSGDQGPGETNGQGVNGKWFAVDSSGRLIDGSGGTYDVASGSTDLGDVLVDAGGLTLYAFLNDGPNDEHLQRPVRPELAAAHPRREHPGRRRTERGVRDRHPSRRQRPADRGRPAPLPLLR